MNRFLLKIAVAATVMATGWADSAAQLRYGFNFGGGFADAKLKDAPGLSVDNRSGFRGGLVLEYQLPNSGLAFDGSILYNRYNARLTDGAETIDFGRDYIDVPLNVKYKFWISSVSNLAAPFIFTGPSMMFHTGSKSAASISMNRFQPGWNVGIGFDIINFLQLQGGYRFGMGNAIHRFTEEPEAKLHTSGWHISAILLFDF